MAAGALCGCLSVLYAVMLTVSSASELLAASYGGTAFLVPVLVFYAVAGVVFIVLGVGSFRRRRWARAIILAGAWVMLVVGAFSLTMTAVILPTALGAMPEVVQQEGMPPGFVLIMTMITLAVGFVFYVLIPGLFVLVYRNGGPLVRADVRPHEHHRHLSRLGLTRDAAGDDGQHVRGSGVDRPHGLHRDRLARLPALAAQVLPVSRIGAVAAQNSV